MTCCVSCTLNLHLKQTNHLSLYGDCNEPCTARVKQQLRGVSNPTLLHCETLDASMVVHGDDFITLTMSKPVPDSVEINPQVYVTLAELLEGEALDIVQNTTRDADLEA